MKKIVLIYDDGVKQEFDCNLQKIKEFIFDKENFSFIDVAENRCVFDLNYVSQIKIE